MAAMTSLVNLIYAVVLAGAARWPGWRAWFGWCADLPAISCSRVAAGAPGFQVAGFQRCGSSSSMRLLSWVGKRVSTSFR